MIEQPADTAHGSAVCIAPSTITAIGGAELALFESLCGLAATVCTADQDPTVLLDSEQPRRADRVVAEQCPAPSSLCGLYAGRPISPSIPYA